MTYQRTYALSEGKLLQVHQRMINILVYESQTITAQGSAKYDSILILVSYSYITVRFYNSGA